MKHLFIIILVLLVSVFTTACINNFAVQELNNNAKEFINKGDTEAAICRLKSSIDLDANVWETHYNLAIAYLTSKNYEEAQKEFQTTLNLNPEQTDAYYSLAISYEQQAEEMIRATKDAEEEDTQEADTEKELPTTEAIVEKLTEANKYYSTYLQKSAGKQDTASISDRISAIEKQIEDLTQNNSENN